MFLHADSEDSDQTGRMPRLIRVFAGRTCHFVNFVMRQIDYVNLLALPFIILVDIDDDPINPSIRLPLAGACIGGTAGLDIDPMSSKSSKSAAPVFGGSKGAAVGMTGDGLTSKRSKIF